MAVFMVNICKFNGCGITFQSLGDLIQHIEDTHIDYDPNVVEKQEKQHPSCLPLSYVLRFFTDAARRQIPVVKPKIKAKAVTKDLTPILRAASPTGSDVEDNEMLSDSDDSNDSWTTTEEFSSEFILRYGSKMVQWNPNQPNLNPDKPFACPVPGCKKRYKNVNGIKYHSKNGHKNVGKVRKGYKCHCGKSYKTGQGLKAHTAAHHSLTLSTGTGEGLQVPAKQITKQVTAPLRTVTLKPLSTTGSIPISLPVKTIQGLMVSSKCLENGGTSLKGSLIDLTSFGSKSANSSSINIENCGLLVNVNAHGVCGAGGAGGGSGASTPLGILTPASSPRTSPSTAAASPEALNVHRVCVSVLPSPTISSVAKLSSHASSDEPAPSLPPTPPPHLAPVSNETAPQAGAHTQLAA